MEKEIRKQQGYYTSGEFAKMARVSVRTIRYYDKLNVLKPTFVEDSGARFYTDADFTKLQQILLLKYLGLSLEDIRLMLVDDVDERMLRNSLNLQLRLIQDRMEQLQLVEKAIMDTTEALEEDGKIDWEQMLNLIHLTTMENSYKTQYQNANNISARIRLHSKYAVNPKGWFPWVYEQLHVKEGMRILELGCGSGALWLDNYEKLPQNVEILLNDISEGMLRDTRRALGTEDTRFICKAFDCERIPFADRSFDLVIANHVLFYCDNLEQTLREVQRVLKPGGVFYCSTYGSRHMSEITRLVTHFDSRIVLSGHNLYEHFGLENGEAMLAPYFAGIDCLHYEDHLLVTDAEPLMEYILSCHGNQNQYILDRYTDFRAFVESKTRDGFYITKDAGMFRCMVE